jgi:hypothetical protein
VTNLRQTLAEVTRPARSRLTTLRRHLDQAVSRYAFGNTAGISNNWAWSGGGPRRKLRRALLPAFQGHASVRRLDRDGFLVLDQPCDDLKMAPLAAKFTSLIEDDRYSIARASAAARHANLFYSRILSNALTLMPELSGVLDAEVQRLVSAYFGGHFEVLDVLAWRNYGPSAEAAGDLELFSDFWHCDRIPATTLKYFVLLEPVDQRKGPLHIQSRRRTRELMRGAFIERGRYNLPLADIESPDHVVKLTGVRGARALCNTVHCLHRAGRPAPGVTRDILQIQFRPSTRPFDLEHLHAISLPSLANKYKVGTPRGATQPRDADA